VIAAILALRIRHSPPQGPSRLREEFHEGLTFVRQRPALIGLAVLGFATTFLGNPFLTFLPAIALTTAFCGRAPAVMVIVLTAVV